MKQPLQAVNGTESAIRIPGTSAHFLEATGQADHGEGSLRYVTGGTGAPLVMVHTVRTQAEHFRHLIPLVRERYTVYALDLPGMGYSQIVPGASYDEAAMRAGVKRLITQLDLRDVTLLGESMGAVLALTTAADLPERVRRVLAVNAYDYAGGIARSGLLARLIVTGVLAPGVGRMFAALNTVEPPILELVTAKFAEGDKPWAEARLPMVEERIRDRLAQLAARLGDADWLDGAFSAGDLIMVSVLLRLRPSGILDEFPELADYVVRGEARPAYGRAFAAQWAFNNPGTAGWSDHAAEFNSLAGTSGLSMTMKWPALSTSVDSAVGRSCLLAFRSEGRDQSCSP